MSHKTRFLLDFKELSFVFDLSSFFWASDTQDEMLKNIIEFIISTNTLQHKMQFDARTIHASVRE